MKIDGLRDLERLYNNLYKDYGIEVAEFVILGMRSLILDDINQSQIIVETYLSEVKGFDSGQLEMLGTKLILVIRHLKTLLLTLNEDDNDLYERSLVIKVISRTQLTGDLHQVEVFIDECDALIGGLQTRFGLELAQFPDNPQKMSQRFLRLESGIKECDSILEDIDDEDSKENRERLKVQLRSCWKELLKIATRVLKYDASLNQKSTG